MDPFNVSQCGESIIGVAMPIFNINPKYLRSVRKALKGVGITGPWEIMPEEPGSERQQVWLFDGGEATFLRMILPYGAISPVAVQ